MAPLAGILAIAAALILSTYGIRPNAIFVDMPVPVPDEPDARLSPPMDRLIVAANSELYWNGQSVSDTELADILIYRMSRTEREALLFTPDGSAPYARVMAVLDLLRRHGAIEECFRFSDIARYRNYDRPATFDDLAPYVYEGCDKANPPFPSDPSPR